MDRAGHSDANRINIDMDDDEGGFVPLFQTSVLTDTRTQPAPTTRQVGQRVGN